MRPPKYPLEPLAKLRRSEADAATGRLGVAQRARDGAERERSRLEDRERAEAAAADVVRAAERERLARGELKAADLAAAGAWESGVAAQRRVVEAAVQRARTTEEEARAGAQKAAREVVSREADATAIESHRSRWSEAQRKRAEAAEEQEAAEARRLRR
jgi:hypothetical protein